MFSGGNVNNEGCSTDDEVASSGDENPLDDLLEALNESSFNISDSPDPKRVFVFTSVRLLGLLSVSKKGSVDGTFKSSARDWYQLFILCVEYRGKFIRVRMVTWQETNQLLHLHSASVVGFQGKRKWNFGDVREERVEAEKNQMRLRNCNSQRSSYVHCSLSAGATSTSVKPSGGK